MTSILPAPPRPTMRRRAALVTATVGSLAFAATAFASLLDPALGRQASWPGILAALVGPTAATSASLAAGIGGTALGAVCLLLGGPRRWSDVAAGVLVVAIALGMPGGAVAMAGYLFAVAVPIGVVLALLLMLRARPLLAAIGLALVASAAIAATTLLDAGALVIRLAAGFAENATGLLLLAAAITAATGWVLWLVLPRRDATPSGPAGWVVRHRRGITLVAAACALPYTIARASWLTPWPLFAPSTQALEETPAMRLMGLLLGTAMLTGGILTLGLISRWGERFPRWLPSIGDRPVPARLAIIPATAVAVLFTFGGIELVPLLVDGADPGRAVQGILVLPFWLWGPALALATWGYAQHRRGQTAAA